MSPGARKLWWRVVHIVAAVAVVGLLYLFLRGIDFGALKAALLRASVLPLVLAAVLNFANMWFKANYWQVMLSTVSPIPAGRLFRSTLASFAGSTLSPVQA